MSLPPTRYRLGTCLALCPPASLVALLVALAFPRTLQIAGQDEILHYVALGQRFYEHGFSHPEELITFSPHLYGVAIWLAHASLGPGVAVARLPGLAAWVLTAAILWSWLVRQPRAGATAGWMLALLVTAPLALQAAAIVDIDNTILVPAVLVLCLAVDHFVAHPGWRPGVGVAAALLVALWCRVTTPVILLPVFLLYAWLSRRECRTAARLTLALAAGGALFLLTWWAYCRATGVDVTGPFHYLVGSLIFCTVGESRGIRPAKIALTVTYVLFWVGPAVLCLWAVLGVERLRRLWRCRKADTDDLFLLASLAILGGYCLVGGTIFGFPKYHCPAFPLLLLALPGTFGTVLRPAGRAGWLAAGGLFLAGAVVQAQLLGDPLLLLRLDLREAVLHGESGRRLLWDALVLPALLAGVPLAALLAALCHRRLLALPAALVCLALGMNAGLVGTQLTGGYQTGYNYGDAGDAQAAAALLDAWLPPGTTAVAPGELVYLLDRPTVRHVPNEIWTAPAALRNELERPGVLAAASSLLTNTMAQLNSLVDVASATPGYQRVDVGHYVIFLRSAPP